MPAPNMPDPLEQHLVDAIFAIPPADTVAEQNTTRARLLTGRSWGPHAGLATLVLRREFADANPEAARKLYRACIRFTRWIDDNSSTAHEIAAKTLVCLAILPRICACLCSRATPGICARRSRNGLGSVSTRPASRIDESAAPRIARKILRV
jgi:hypothetical protein